MSKKPLSSLRDGDRVYVRGERWRVNGTEAFGDCETLYLTGCDRDNRDVLPNFLREDRIWRRKSKPATKGRVGSPFC